MPGRLPAGWSVVSRSPRRYRSPSGQVVNRKTYERLAGRLGNWRTRDQYDYWRQKEGWVSYRRLEGESAANMNLTRKDVTGAQSEFSQLYAAAVNSNWDTDPDGPYSDLLVYAGLRDTEDDWDVGSTNPT